MTMLLTRYSRADYDSYEDFQANFHIDVPERFNFAVDVMDEMARLEPEGLALLWCDVEGREARFTFAQMKEASDRAARFFQDQGIGKGDRVMLMLKRRYQYWFCVLGLCKIGAVAIPATHLLTAKDIIYRVNAAEVKMLVSVAEPRVVSAISQAKRDDPMKTLHTVALQGLGKDGQADPGALPGALDLDAELHNAAPAYAAPADVKNDDIMLLYFTSGTTGMPKMVAHDFVYPLGHIVTARFWHNLRPGSIHLTVSDSGWAKTAWGKIYGQWLCGATVFVYDFERFVAKDLLTVMKKHGVTSFCAPPTLYRYLVKEDIRKYGLTALEYATVAGEPLSPEVFNEFREQTGLELKEGFGQTETSLQVFTTRWVKPRPGSMGKPNPLFDMRLVDEDGAQVEVGEEGEIVLAATPDKRPPSLFLGYWMDEALTKSVWRDGVYHTGDMAWMDEDGYFWFVGRGDDVIKSSGYRIGPFEVESALLTHPAVLECAITAVPDEERGQVVKATVVLMQGYEAGDKLVKELQDHVKRATAPYKYPRIIEFAAELPKTISGKIRRAELRKRDKG